MIVFNPIQSIEAHIGGTLLAHFVLSYGRFSYKRLLRSLKPINIDTAWLMAL